MESPSSREKLHTGTDGLTPILTLYFTMKGLYQKNILNFTPIAPGIRLVELEKFANPNAFVEKEEVGRIPS